MLDNLSLFEFGYLVGFIDGEGYIGIVKQNIEEII